MIVIRSTGRWQVCNLVEDLEVETAKVVAVFRLMSKCQYIPQRAESQYRDAVRVAVKLEFTFVCPYS